MEKSKNRLQKTQEDSRPIKMHIIEERVITSRSSADTHIQCNLQDFLHILHKTTTVNDQNNLLVQLYIKKSAEA